MKVGTRDPGPGGGGFSQRMHRTNSARAFIASSAVRFSRWVSSSESRVPAL